jgi:hypothetical protein
MNPKYLLLVLIGVFLIIKTKQQEDLEDDENDTFPFEKMNQTQIDNLISAIEKNPNEFSVLYDGMNDGYFIKLIKLMVFLKEEYLNLNGTSFLYDGTKFDFKEMLEVVTIANNEE